MVLVVHFSCAKALTLVLFFKAGDISAYFMDGVPLHGPLRGTAALSVPTLKAILSFGTVFSHRGF